MAFQLGLLKIMKSQAPRKNFVEVLLGPYLDHPRSDEFQWFFPKVGEILFRLARINHLLRMVSWNLNIDVLGCQPFLPNANQLHGLLP